MFSFKRKMKNQIQPAVVVQDDMVKVANMDAVFAILIKTGFIDDSTFRYHITQRSSYSPNGAFMELEYTDRSANLRFIASSTPNGKLRKVTVMSHRGNDTPEMAAANAALVSII